MDDDLTEHGDVCEAGAFQCAAGLFATIGRVPGVLGTDQEPPLTAVVAVRFHEDPIVPHRYLIFRGADGSEAEVCLDALRVLPPEFRQTIADAIAP